VAIPLSGQFHPCVKKNLFPFVDVFFFEIRNYDAVFLAVNVIYDGFEHSNQKESVKCFFSFRGSYNDGPMCSYKSRVEGGHKCVFQKRISL